MQITLYGDPRTKKNNPRIKWVGGKPKVLPSAQYKGYEYDCLKQITGKHKKAIGYPINLQVVYYMETRRKCDLVNLLQATNDILVAANVLEDDNYSIVYSMNGSRVLYDKENPRAEITITKI